MALRRVLVNGVFDLFHIGHVRYLQAAAAMGDELWVGLTADFFVDKGPGRPVYSQDERYDVVNAMRCVSKVIIVNSSLDALERSMPTIFVKGEEYRYKIRDDDRTFCMDNRIEIRFTNTETERPRDRLLKG